MITDKMAKAAATEYLSYKGERPYRVTRRGAELWEDHVDAMRAALEAALLAQKQEPVAWRWKFTDYRASEVWDYMPQCDAVEQIKKTPWVKMEPLYVAPPAPAPAVMTKAEDLARELWGYFKGDSTGGTTAMRWFDNNKSLGGPAHIIKLCLNALSQNIDDGSCRKCGCAPRNKDGLCATCVDEAPAVTVKALEWWHSKKENNPVWIAKTGGVCVHYVIEFCSIDPFPYMLHATANGLTQTPFKTLEEAKAAAQADYERRILSALATQQPNEEVTG